MRSRSFFSRAVRAALPLATVLAPFALAASCSSSEAGPGAGAGALSGGCSINSDCASPLVCAFQRCHSACETTRDCTDGERCMASDRPFHVCQLPAEQKCAYNSDCPEGQRCAVDGACRDQCGADRDCVTGQLCASGTCAEPAELHDGRLPVAEAGTDQSSGVPCQYSSECPSPLVCRGAVCSLECLANADCAGGQVCEANACHPVACGGDAGLDGAGASCVYDSECPAPLVCHGGICTCECLANADCAPDEKCAGARCVPLCPPENKCPNGCFDLTSDLSNCGTCGHACAPADPMLNEVAACTGGVCTTPCTALRGDCNASPQDGCEQDLASDIASCGACGKACDGGGCNAGVCAPSPILLASGLGLPLSPVTDGTSLFVSDGSNVWRLPKGGLPEGGTLPSPLTTVAGGVRDLAVAGGTLFVLTATDLETVPTSGGATTVAYSPIVSGGKLVLDASNVYFTDRGDWSLGVPGYVYQLPLTATDAGAALALASPAGGYPDTIAVFGGNVVFSQGIGTSGIFSVPVGGGATTTLLPGTAPDAIGVDATTVFFSTSMGLYSFPLSGLADGGAPTELVAAGEGAPFFATDATTLFWIDSMSGWVYSTPKVGGGVKTLATGSPPGSWYGYGLTVDATSVYVVLDDGRAFVFPK